MTHDDDDDDGDDDVSQEPVPFVSLKPLKETRCSERAIQFYVSCTERFFSPSAMRSHRSRDQSIGYLTSTSGFQLGGGGS